MLTIEEIRKSLDAGNDVDLECIDEMGFINRHKCNAENNEIILNQGRLTVATVCNDMDSVILKGNINPDISNTIHFEELKYFRIKRPAPTFHDLIDVATQALKDGLLSKLDIIEGNCIGGTVKKGLSNVLHFHTGIATDIQSRIDFIKSLYTETFVIEGEEDIKRIKQYATIEFQNGNKVAMDNPPCDTGIVRIWDDGRYDFTVLKGATVTQRRDAQC